jgi:hypothetical protein
MQDLYALTMLGGSSILSCVTKGIILKFNT